MCFPRFGGYNLSFLNDWENFGTILEGLGGHFGMIWKDFQVIVIGFGWFGGDILLLFLQRVFSIVFKRLS